MPSRPAPRQRAAAATTAPMTMAMATVTLGADHHVSGISDGASTTPSPGARNGLCVTWPAIAPNIPSAQIQTTVTRTLRPIGGTSPASTASTVPATTPAPAVVATTSSG